MLAPGQREPDGRAVPAGDGTYSLSGHWQFGTGICHADWVLLSGKIEGDDRCAPATSSCRVDEVEVKDTWHVDGMAATGSRDIVATDVIVPERRVSLDAAARTCSPGPATRTCIASRSPPFLSLTAALPAVGAAQASARAVRGAARSTGSCSARRGPRAHRVPTQVRLANLSVEVDFAETLLRDVAGRMQAHADGRSTSTCSASCTSAWPSPTSCAAAATSCARSWPSSGASVHYLDHELQRIHRDVHMICAHTVFDVDLVAEGVGRPIVAAPRTDSRRVM